jgi:uroporphyrinogen decarboxylase
LDSHERVLASLNHIEPEGLPVDIGATPSSGISAVAYSNLNRHLGNANSRTLVYDVVQQLAQPEDSFLDYFRIDAVDLGRSFNSREEDWHEDILPTSEKRVFLPSWFKPIKRPNGSWDVFDTEGDRIATMPIGAYFFDQTYYPYLDRYPDNYANLPWSMGKVHWSGLAHSPWDHASELDFWAQLRQRSLALRAQTDRALVVVAGCNLFEWGTFLRRIDNFLVDLLTEPIKVEGLLDALMERHLATLEKVCESVGDIADIIRFGDDLGTDQGPFFRPELTNYSSNRAIPC